MFFLRSNRIGLRCISHVGRCDDLIAPLFIFSVRPQEEANRKQTTSSTYVVEDSDIPPPRYQKDGRLSPYYQSNNSNQMMIHPKNLQMQNPSQMSFLPSSNYDDQFMNQKNYVKIPSPGPPMDGSYYSACDRYLSYPPMVSLTPKSSISQSLIPFVLSPLIAGSSVGLFSCISDTASQHVQQLGAESHECGAQQHVKPSKQ